MPLPLPQLNLIHSEVSHLAGFDVEGVINPTNADLELKDDLGERSPAAPASLPLPFSPFVWPEGLEERSNIFLTKNPSKSMQQVKKRVCASVCVTNQTGKNQAGWKKSTLLMPVVTLLSDH